MAIQVSLSPAAQQTACRSSFNCYDFLDYSHRLERFTPKGQSKARR